MVLAFSDRIPRVPSYSGFSLRSNSFTYGALTLSRCAFQHSSVTVLTGLWSPLPQKYYYSWFGLFRFRSPLLSESFIYFLFLWVIRCFSSPRSPRITIDSLYDTITLLMVSFLIRTSTDQCLFATPRSLSQLVTSFFGAMYQGILLYALCSLIFFNWRYRVNRRFILFLLLDILQLDLNFVNRSYAFFRINLTLFIVYLLFCLIVLFN